jgi:hypothetical protein
MAGMSLGLEALVADLHDSLDDCASTFLEDITMLLDEAELTHCRGLPGNITAACNTMDHQQRLLV